MTYSVPTNHTEASQENPSPQFGDNYLQALYYVMESLNLQQKTAEYYNGLVQEKVNEQIQRNATLASLNYTTVPTSTNGKLWLRFDPATGGYVALSDSEVQAIALNRMFTLTYNGKTVQVQVPWDVDMQKLAFTIADWKNKSVEDNNIVNILMKDYGCRVYQTPETSQGSYTPEQLMGISIENQGIQALRDQQTNAIMILQQTEQIVSSQVQTLGNTTSQTISIASSLATYSKDVEEKLEGLRR